MARLMIEIMAEAALKRAEEMTDRVEDGAALLGRMGELIQDHMDDVYDTGNYGRWRKLNPVTVKLKGDNTPLVRTGSLMRDLTGKPRVAGEDVGIFTQLKHAQYMKKGMYWKRSGAKRPKRNPAPMPPKQVRAWWDKSLLGYINGQRL